MVFETPARPESGVTDFGGVLGGSLFGAVLGGIGMQLLAPGLLTDLGSLVGDSTYATGWVLLLALGVVLGAAFVAVCSRVVDAFVQRVIAVSRHSATLRMALLPLLYRSAFGVTAAGLGLVYGLAVGATYVLVVPAALTRLGQAVPLGYGLAFPALVAFLCWAAYGSAVGLVYGLAKERV